MTAGYFGIYQSSGDHKHFQLPIITAHLPIYLQDSLVSNHQIIVRKPCNEQLIQFSPKIMLSLHDHDDIYKHKRLSFSQQLVWH